MMTEKRYNPFSDDYDILGALNNMQEIQKHTQISNEDIMLVTSSIIFNQYFDRVYSILKGYCNYTKINLNTMLQGFMAIPNRDYFITSKMISNNIGSAEKNNFDIRNMNAMYTESPLEGVGNINLRSICEDGISILNILLNYMKYCVKKLSQNKIKDIDENEWENIIYVYRDVNIYYELKDAYDDAVWNEGTVMIKEDGKIYITFPDKERLQINCVGDWRIDKLISERILTTYTALNNCPDLRKKLFYSKRRLYIEKVNVKDSYIQCFTNEKIKPTKEDRFNILHMEELDLFYPYIEDIELEAIEGLTLKDIISLYDILSEIIIVLEKTKSVDDRFESFSYKMKRKDLIKCLKQTSIFSKSQIESFLKLVASTFEQKQRIDLYKKPLFFFDDTYYMNALLLNSPNTLYMMDEWLGEAGYDLKRRGTIFERYLKDKLSELLTDKEIEHKVVNKNKFNVNKKNGEEVDLIIVFDRAIIVGEVKCIKYPMEPRGFHNMYKILDEAATQLQRKIEFLIKYKEKFAEEIDGIGEKEIIRVVVTNYPLFTGYSINNIPIIDNFTFEKYISMGKMRAYSVKYENNVLHEKELYEEKFYQDKEGFYRNMQLYFKNPLVIKTPLKNVRIKDSIIITKELGIEMYKECAVMGEETVLEKSPIS